MTLTAEDLLNLSHTADILKVDRIPRDRIVLADGCIDQDIHGFYHTYVHDDAILLVGQNMTTEIAQ